MAHLRSSVVKSEMLALEQPHGERIEGITVVHKMKFLRVPGGDLKEGEEYDESMNKIRHNGERLGSVACRRGSRSNWCMGGCTPRCVT